MADEESLAYQRPDDLDTVVIIPVVAENALLGDRPSRDMERSCMRRAR